MPFVVPTRFDRSSMCLMPLLAYSSCLSLGWRADPKRVALNFAPPHSGRTTGEMVSKLATAWGPTALVSENTDIATFPDQRVLRLDGSKAAYLLAWTPALDRP